jgi:hypothetical protein
MPNVVNTERCDFGWLRKSERPHNVLHAVSDPRQLARGVLGKPMSIVFDKYSFAMLEAVGSSSGRYSGVAPGFVREGLLRGLVS